MSYYALIEDIVAAQRDVLGEEAVGIAQSIGGLAMGDDGSVQSIDGDDVRTVDELVGAYVDNLGQAATITLQSVADEYAGDLDLPSSLQ